MHGFLIYFIPTTSIPFIIPARPGRLDTPLLTIAVATRKAGHRKASRRDEVENPSLFELTSTQPSCSQTRAITNPTFSSPRRLSSSYLSPPFTFYRQ
ncbi:hypothetical protein IAS59_005611 [Cryptococcus gattii]